MKNKTTKKQIAVVFGGQSGEHEVSLRSAFQVMKALNKDKYDIVTIAITKSGHWLVGEDGRRYLEDNLAKAAQKGGVERYDFPDKKNKLPEDLPAVDLVLPIMHGTFGEDGKLQGLLEMLGMPFVFSGTLAGALAMNKRLTKIIAKAVGLKVAKDAVVLRGRKYYTKKIIDRLGLPVVIKPAELGSSVGASLANSPEEIASGIEEALSYGHEVLLEQFIKGRELTVSILGGKSSKALPVAEIIPRTAEWFDYQAKYKSGGATEVCPAKIPEEIRQKVQRMAVKIFKTIGCLDLARADFIWRASDNKLYFLEINTIPGMTATSLAPQAAASAGIEFSEFLDKLIESALKRYRLG